MSLEVPPLVSADSHVNEPRELWLERLPARLRDRAPRVESFPKGDAWVLEDSPHPVPFRRNACAGKSVWAGEGGPWMRWEEVPASSSDPAARLREQDLDGVVAEVLFPTPNLQAHMVSRRDPELNLALVQAYNDWMSEYCSHAPDRLLGLALLPNRGVEGAVRELERVLQLPGIAGAMIGLYPHGDDEIHPDDDALWAVFQEAGVPVAIHVGLNGNPPQGTPLDAPESLPAGIVRFLDAPKRLYEFIYRGVLDRFPRLQLLFAETDAGWLPCWREQAFNRWRRQSPSLRAAAGLVEPPTTYLERCSFTYISDSFAVRNRHEVGIRQLLWSSDYPHSESDYPHSWRAIKADFADVPVDEAELILRGNCLRLFGRATAAV